MNLLKDIIMKKTQTLHHLTSALICAALCIILFSCNKDDYDGLSTKDDFCSSALKVASDYKEIVDLMSQIDLDNEVCRDVFYTVSQSVDFGLDEELLFRELWDTETKVSSSSNSSLKAKIEEYFQNTPKTKAISLIEDELKYSNVSIYWPYSEDWDGKTLPTITCPPEDLSQSWNYGYRTIESNEGVVIDTVIVDENYSMEYPVWIIKDSKYDYSDLPDFLNGEWIQNGTAYISEKRTSPSKVATKAESDTPMYMWKMVSMQVSKQYDKVFWNGGSEFKIAASFPTAAGYAGSTNTFNITFTRKQIRTSTPKEFDETLNYNWTENQITNGLAIWEVNGKKATMDYTLGCTVAMGPSNATHATVSATVKISPKDELITNREYTRSYMFSSLGETEQLYDEGNVICKYSIVEYYD